MIELSKKKLDEIISKYGSAVYLFDYNDFKANYDELKKAFCSIYPNYNICYSFKTNYTPFICKCVKELGGYAEVVSDMEYELALKIGFDPKQIVYNGPAKGNFLESHLFAHGINNVDRIEEAERICEFAVAHSEIIIKTGIRVNFDIEAGYISRFGIEINQLDEVLSLLKKSGVIVNGIHCHMSRARGIDAWKKRTTTMLNLVKQYELTDIEYISLGSGMYGKMDPELQIQFSGNIPTYEEYANCVAGQFSKFYKNSDKQPILFTEPGTTVISKYMDFIGKVIGIKQVRGKTFVLLNCSSQNLGEICQIKNPPIRVHELGNRRILLQNADFVGYTCLEQDVLFRGYTGELSIGDIIQFGNIGGYSIVNKPPFIQPDCPAVAIKDGNIHLIKRTETSEDLFSTFCFNFY